MGNSHYFYFITVLQIFDREIVYDRNGLLPNRTETETRGKKITEPNRNTEPTETTEPTEPAETTEPKRTETTEPT